MLIKFLPISPYVILVAPFYLYYMQNNCQVQFIVVIHCSEILKSAVTCCFNSAPLSSILN